MAKDYSYLFSQLRRIEDHREEQAVKEGRKIYRKILKETKQFVAEEYYQLAEDGKLTFDILRSKGQDARFLQEIEQRLGDLTIDISNEIKRTTEEVYKISYEGLRDAVQKSKDAAQFQQLLQINDTVTAQTMWATVDNTIMDIALERNHKEITWDIKRLVAQSLTVGDRFETMAHNIADTLDRSYKKAMLITRTEVGRVREAGHLASAKNLNETLKEGSSGLQMVKKWKSVKDGSVRDQHREMHNKVVLMDEYFELPDGTKTQAPKQSGVARHDCNCRCTALYPLMDDAEFFKATGRHFYTNPVEDSEKHGIIKSFSIGRGLGAAAKNYPVKMPESRQHVKLAEDQLIDGTAFAGKGTKAEIRDKFRLESEYGYPADSWQKVSGKGFVVVGGKNKLAELHWYESDGEMVEFKVKRFLDDEG